MTSKKGLGLSESIFGGGLTDETGIFGKSSQSSPPPKRQKLQEKDHKTKSTTHSQEKTPLQIWKERQEKFDPDKQEDDNPYTLVRTEEEPEHAFAEEVSSTVKMYGMAVVKNAVDIQLLDRLQICAKKQRKKICKALQSRNLTYNDDSNNDQEVRFQEVVVRCKGRMDARYLGQDSDSPFWNDHSLLHKIIGTLLFGEENTPTLVYAGWIFSFPGSSDQPWHQDGIPLFPGSGIASSLPPYAINVFIPLSDEDASLKAGPTEFVVGSHRMDVEAAMEATKKYQDDPSIACPLLKQGDLLLYDYRICHRGTANLTHVTEEAKSGSNISEGRVRNILYLMYARPWFQEHLNFGTEKLCET